MKMEPLNSGELRIWMTNGELARWGLNTQTMRAGERGTDRVLRRLLAVARQRMDFCGDGVVTVEALPLEGGCLFLVSGGHHKAMITEPQIFVFDSAEHLLQFAQALSCGYEPALYPGASLYRQAKRYFLIVYTGWGAVRHVCRMAEEFGVLVGSGTTVASAVEEHATAIQMGDAINRLCEVYGSPQPIRRHLQR